MLFRKDAMDLFKSPPLSVHTKTVGYDATYTDAALWLHSDDETAIEAMRRVRQDNCVLFIQIGGMEEVMCVAPHALAPNGVFVSTRPTSKARGERGEAIMMFYH